MCTRVLHDGCNYLESKVFILTDGARFYPMNCWLSGRIVDDDEYILSARSRTTNLEPSSSIDFYFMAQPKVSIFVNVFCSPYRHHRFIVWISVHPDHPNGTWITSIFVSSLVYCTPHTSLYWCLSSEYGSLRWHAVKRYCGIPFYVYSIAAYRAYFWQNTIAWA